MERRVSGTPRPRPLDHGDPRTPMAWQYRNINYQQQNSAYSERYGLSKYITLIQLILWGWWKEKRKCNLVMECCTTVMWSKTLIRPSDMECMLVQICLKETIFTWNLYQCVNLTPWGRKIMNSKTNRPSWGIFIWLHFTSPTNGIFTLW